VSTASAPLDLAAVKARQQQVWASGDYSVIAERIQVMAERLVDALDLDAGDRLLDVAGGSGNAALAAARAGYDVVCSDYVPSLLERARERAAAERVPVELREADAEALPFEDASFDAVVSVVGVMFTPDQERAAAELLRVCRPGGTIALASWTPDGFVGEMLRTVGRHVPPPAGLRPPTVWGTEERLAELLGGDVQALRHEHRTYTFRHRSAEAFVDDFREFYGPVHKAFGTLEDDGRAALRDDLLALVRRFDVRGGEGPVAMPSAYMETVARR
jgi:ubiquinone/menaquinone biosynthesis C-methylase UbiE